MPTFELLPNSALTIQSALKVWQNFILHYIRCPHLLLLLLHDSFMILNRPRLTTETVRLSDDTTVPYDPFVPMLHKTVPLLFLVVIPSL